MILKITEQSLVLLYLKVSTRAVIGQFSGLFFCFVVKLLGDLYRPIISTYIANIKLSFSLSCVLKRSNDLKTISDWFLLLSTCFRNSKCENKRVVMFVLYVCKSGTFFSQKSARVWTAGLSLLIQCNTGSSTPPPEVFPLQMIYIYYLISLIIHQIKQQQHKHNREGGLHTRSWLESIEKFYKTLETVSPRIW